MWLGRLVEHHRLLVSLALGVWVFVFWGLQSSRQQDVFEKSPFCNADGTCHEKPDQPSPRTIYSAKSQEQFDKWWRAHAILNQTAQEFAANLPANKQKGKRPLVFYGDSITESWIGSDMQVFKERTRGIPQVFEEIFLQPRLGLNPFVAAIGGDQTQHLLYRLQHGQLLPAFANDSVAVFCVLIGTNNLGAGELPGPTTEGIVAVTDYLLQHTQGYILLLKLLPRADNFRLPPHWKSYSTFMPAIRSVNQALDNHYEKYWKIHGERQRLKIFDCGEKYLQNDEDIIQELMPDTLHPNAEGQRILGNCIISAFHNGFDLFA